MGEQKNYDSVNRDFAPSLARASEIGLPPGISVNLAPTSLQTLSNTLRVNG